MPELPFLVVHGALVAKLLVLLMVLTMLGVVWRVRRKTDADRARSALEEWLRQVGAPAEGDVTLSGTLRDAGGQRWLDCAGERVDLAGEVHVARGTRVTWSRWQRTASQSVSDGDDVLASGRLVRQLGNERAADGYRSAATGWTMTPAGAGPIVVMARQPAICARRPGWIGVVACAVLSYGALYGAGALVRSSISRARELPEDDTGGILGAFAITSIAAALPGAREGALDALDERFEDRLARTPDTIEMRVVLARLRRGCEGEVYQLLDEDLLERAHVVAMSCNDREHATLALLELGRYDEAAQVAPEDPGSIAIAGIAMIGAGRWSDAARLAERRAGWRMLDYALRKGVDANAPTQDPGIRDLCLAEVFRAHGGDGHAVERLHALARVTGSAACAELEPFATGRVDELINAALGSDHQVDAIEYGGSHAPWLAPFASTGLSSPSYRRWMAVYHTYLGDFAAMRRDVAAFRPATRDDDLVLALQANLGEPVEPGHALADPYALERALSFIVHPHSDSGKRPEQRYVEKMVRGDKMDLAYPAALSGNGLPLAWMIRHYWPYTAINPGWTLAVLPYVRLYRAELVDAVRVFRFERERGFSPFVAVHNAAIRRDLMRIAGHPTLAARWQSIVERHASMLADRDRVFALRLW